MINDACCLIVKLVETPDGYFSLSALGMIKAVRISANGRTMVHLNAIVTCDEEGGAILVEEPWHKCNPTKYYLKTIEWVEYTRRGTEAEYIEYMANRKKIEAQRTPE